MLRYIFQTIIMICMATQSFAIEALFDNTPANRTSVIDGIMQENPSLSRKEASKLFASRIPAPITPEITHELVGTWYEDHEQWVKMMARLEHMMPEDVLKKFHTMLIQKKQAGGKEYETIKKDLVRFKLVVDPNLMATDASEIKYPVIINKDHYTIHGMDVYKIGSQFYHDSHIIGPVPITKTPPDLAALFNETTLVSEASTIKLSENKH